LLAHALLFEVDYVLKNRTNDSFVRWMDDINFGVSNLRSAKIILGEISDVLKSRGLALNLGKTEVMTSKEAEHHFLFRENLRLNKVQKHVRKLKSLQAKAKLANKLQHELASHLKSCRARNRDKVTKRFLSILGALGVPAALPQARLIYASQPSLRASVLRYFSRLPFSHRVAKTFLQLLQETEQYDDATRFGFVEAVVRWSVPHDASGIRFVTDIRRQLGATDSQFDWLCFLVFLSKYGQPHEVLNAVVAGRQIKDAFFARQRMAALARALGINPKSVKSQWHTETSTGYSDSASVANNLLNFSRGVFPTKRNLLYLYLFPTQVQQAYPLPKFLLLCCLAQAEAGAGKMMKRPEVSAHVRDAWYQHWLGQIHPYWF